jgi:hypothetical protein
MESVLIYSTSVEAMHSAIIAHLQQPWRNEIALPKTLQQQTLHFSPPIRDVGSVGLVSLI